MQKLGIKLVVIAVTAFWLATVGTPVYAADMAAEQVAAIKSDIERLVDEYAITRDALDAEANSNLFLEDGAMVLFGNRHEGRDLLKKRIEDVDPGTVSLHIMSSGNIDVIDEANATGVQYVVVYTGTQGEEYVAGDAVEIGNFALMGMYHDTYKLTHDGWKFSERRFESVFRGAQ